MAENFAVTVLGMLDVKEPSTEVSVWEAELRATIMLQAALLTLHRSLGHDEAVKLTVDAFGKISEANREAVGRMLASAPAVQLTELLLGHLRQRDPANPDHALAAHRDAEAMILAGISFLQERHGTLHTSAFVANMMRAVAHAGVAGEYPVSAPAERASVRPPPDSVENLTAKPREGLTLHQRINTMSDFLRAGAPEEAKADAMASLMASGVVLRERFGEGFAIGALRQVEASVSQIAALDRWQPESGAQH